MNYKKITSSAALSTIRFISITLLFLYIFALCSAIKAQTDTSSAIWYLDRLENIGGLTTTKLNNAATGPASEYPQLVDSPFGKSAYFDGINDGLLVLGNPLGSSPSFTMEILFNPLSGPKNDEKRFIHIRSKSSDARRILLELTPLSNNQWTFKTFILSEKNSLDAFDSLRYRHEFNQWYHAALVYENGVMHNYINRVHEASGQVTYIPIDNGQISIGARQDPRSWLKGTIRFIKFTRRALTPAEFTGIPATNLETDKTIPASFKLYQNYPNPFNPGTVIRWQIVTGSYVTLKVYNLLGREVATLVDEYKQPGIYNSQFSITNLSNGFHRDQLSSGVYYYQLRAGSFFETKKFILMK